MVDLSVFFIALRYITTYFEGEGIPLQKVLQAATALCIAVAAIGLVIHCAKKKKDGAFARLIWRSATVGFGMALFTLLNAVWPSVSGYVSEKTGIAARSFTALSAGVSIGLFSLAMFISARFFTKDPNNQSLLSTRQVYNVMGFVSAGLLVLYLLQELVTPVFQGFLLFMFVSAELLSILFWFYDPFIYILSQFFTGRKKVPCKPTPGRINRFAVIGCAHNEQNVIGQLVKSLYSTAYPKNHYDIYVICDNCTDETARVVRESGAIAMERNDPDHRGKGFGLKWMFQKLEEEEQRGNKYDAYIVLDADNVVNEAFFDAINEKMNEGYEILQTYLGCKNPGDTWVSMCYSYAYWVSNSIYQDAHSRIGLSAQMGGTGMVLRPSVLRDIGWDTDSLTEDLVLTSRYLLGKNLSCCWVHEAKLYDEKPLKLIPSIRQRTRWMQGHMAAMFKFAPKLFLSGIRHLSLKQLDLAFYLCRPFLNLLLLVTYLVHIYYNIFEPQSSMSISFVMGQNTSMLLLLGSFTLQFFVLFRERYARYIPSFILQLGFSFSWYPAMFRGLIKNRERYWVSTVHTRSISITEVAEDARRQEAKERLKGLDNLHRLPLGQILLKATVITRQQLDDALTRQSEQGGFLGDIIVDMNAITQETLSAYLSVQQSIREEASKAGRGDEHLRLGDILVDAGLITQEQLENALAYQKKMGGLLGECLIATRVMPVDLLQVLLEVQKLLDVNFVSSTGARVLIRGLMESRTENIGTLLQKGGLVSESQMKLALEHQQQSGRMIGETLVDDGFISQPTLDIMLALQTKGRAFISKQKDANVPEEVLQP